MNGSLGRINGSIGLALNFPHYQFEVSPNDELEVIGEQINLVKEAALIFYKHFKFGSKATIKIKRTIPRHVGLGSTTQAFLGVGTALSALHNIKQSTTELARIMNRGGTSGIGTAAFRSGGFILDGGHSLKITKRERMFIPSSVSKLPPPPILLRYNFPKNWKFVIGIPNVQRGLHGLKEVKLFEERCPVPPEEIDKICRIILMKMLPALMEKDVEEFGLGLTSLQNLGFAKAASDLVHPATKACMKVMMENGAYGVGQSSFGPTTYSVVKGIVEARNLSRLIKRFLDEEFNGGYVFYSEANNNGHELKIDE